MTKVKSWLKKDFNETRVLFRNLPVMPFAILCAALIAMNFLANKGIITNPEVAKWFSADSGIIVSWIAFLAGDMLVKRFGAKAAIKVNIAAIGVQIVAVLLLTIGAMLPGTADFGIGYSLGLDGSVDTLAFNTIFKAGVWPMIGGTLAFCLATVVDSIMSKFILTRFRNRTTFKSYAVASYVSTAVGQFLDNMFFALFFSIWQGWFAFGGNDLSNVLTSLITFSAFGMVAELIGQAILSPIGFKMTRHWSKLGIGNEYIDLVEEAQEVNMENAEVKHGKVRPVKVVCFVLSVVALVSSVLFGIYTRLNVCTNPEPFVLDISNATLNIVVVYVLAFVAFGLYVAGAAISSKKEKVA